MCRKVSGLSPYHNVTSRMMLPQKKTARKAIHAYLGRFYRLFEKSFLFCHVGLRIALLLMLECAEITPLKATERNHEKRDR